MRAFLAPPSRASELRLARQRTFEEEQEKKNTQAEALGLRWPRVRKQRRGAGRPIRADKYEEALYDAIESATLPEDATAVMPVWWRPGLPLVKTEEHMAEQMAEQVAHAEQLDDTPLQEEPRGG